MATVGLIGTFDTKRVECEYLAARIRARGAAVLTIDVGPLSDAETDVTAADVARAAGEDIADLRRRADRGAAMDVMARGAAAVVAARARGGDIDAVLAAGGSGGSSVASRAMRALPVGFPKLLVSTMACGDVSPYVGQTDIAMVYSVVDVAGINSVSSQVFGNAAAAAAGMAEEYEWRRAEGGRQAKPVVALSMFGLTTPAVDEAREVLDGLGYETLVFHATGSGGRALEKLAADGRLAGVLDLTTTELADELVGGILTAGPDRLTAAGAAGIPQVVSFGALDMVNFGPREDVPERFEGRTFVVHNPVVTLMRTTPGENAELGRRIGEKALGARGPVALVLPLRGVSGIDAEAGPFRDEEADAVLFEAVRRTVAGSPAGDVRIVECDAHINDPGFGARSARLLHRMIEESAPAGRSGSAA